VKTEHYLTKLKHKYDEKMVKEQKKYEEYVSKVEKKSLKD